jgi:hypothetical protein
MLSAATSAVKQVKQADCMLPESFMIEKNNKSKREDPGTNNFMTGPVVYLNQAGSPPHHPLLHHCPAPS